MGATGSEARGPSTAAATDAEGTPGAMLVDCGTCAVRGLACHDCVVTVLLGPPPESGFGIEEQRALAVLAQSGLVPRLRMVQPVDPPRAGGDDPA